MDSLQWLGVSISWNTEIYKTNGSFDIFYAYELMNIIFLLQMKSSHIIRFLLPMVPQTKVKYFDNAVVECPNNITNSSSTIVQGVMEIFNKTTIPSNNLESQKSTNWMPTIPLKTPPSLHPIVAFHLHLFLWQQWMKTKFNNKHPTFLVSFCFNNSCFRINIIHITSYYLNIHVTDDQFNRTYFSDGIQKSAATW